MELDVVDILFCCVQEIVFAGFDLQHVRFIVALLGPPPEHYLIAEIIPAEGGVDHFYLPGLSLVCIERDGMSHCIISILFVACCLCYNLECVATG
jgi:hypothetical protein